MFFHNCIGNKVIKRWTNVRDAFAKFCKKEKENKKSGSGAFKHKKYVYNDQLMFLKKKYIERDVVEKSKKISRDTARLNFDIDTDIDEQTKTLDNEDSIQATPIIRAGQKLGSRSKKRKPDEIEMRLLKALEADDTPNRHLSFFHGVLPALDKFDENEVLKFQIGVLQLISKINNEKQKVSLPPFPQQHTSTSKPKHYMMPLSYQSPQTAAQYYPNYGEPTNSNTTAPLNRSLESISPAQSTSSCNSDIDFSTF